MVDRNIKFLKGKLGKFQTFMCLAVVHRSKACPSIALTNDTWMEKERYEIAIAGRTEIAGHSTHHRGGNLVGLHFTPCNISAINIVIIICY